MRHAIVALGLMIGLIGSPLIYAASPATKAAPKAPAAATKPAPAPKEATSKGIVDSSYKEVEPLSLLRGPDQWVGEKVSFTAKFVTFSPYALDYKGAMRESKNYIAFLIQRPDVTHHVIPLSELKLIYPRKNAEKVMALESGDKVLVKGKVFSAALGDPWLDVDEVILLYKSPENAAKDKKKSKNSDLE